LLDVPVSGFTRHWRQLAKWQVDRHQLEVDAIDHARSSNHFGWAAHGPDRAGRLGQRDGKFEPPSIANDDRTDTAEYFRMRQCFDNNLGTDTGRVPHCYRDLWQFGCFRGNSHV